MEHSVHSDNARRDERAPFSALVELRREGGDEALSADGVDISEGGAALRAAFLPEVGTRLACSFRFSADSDLVRVVGEVVWAAWDGYREGSFGLRFLDLSTKSAKAIRGFVVPQGAHGGRDGCLGPANLNIEGVAVPIEAEVRFSEKDCLVLEQELTFLRLGRAVEVDLPGQGQRRGRIGSITLRQGPLDVPTLVFGVLVDEVEESTEVTPDPLRAAITSQRKVELGTEATEAAMRLDEVSLDNPFDLPAPAASPFVEPAHHERKAMPPPPDGVELAPDALDAEATSDLALPRSEGLFGLLAAGSEQLVRAWRRLVLFVRALVQRLSDTEQSPLARAGQLWGKLAAHWGAFRRVIAGLRPREPRRSTSPVRVQRARPGPRRGRGGAGGAPRNRKLYAAALGVVGVGLGVYALAPRSEASRMERAQPEVSEESESASEVEPSKASAPRAKPARKAEKAKPSVPAGPKPKAAALKVVRQPQKAKPAPAPARKVVVPPFGAGAVPNGRTFVLRMDGQVTALRGESRADGFTVRVPGRLALDRASPIAISHGAVARAMILNRGQHAELTVDFVPGLQPKYQVRASDRTLEVTLQRL